MSKMLPAKRPAQTRPEIEKIIAAQNVNEALVLVGIRGYYRDSMGKVGVNDRNIYDDALFVVSPNVFASFNANCDPSEFRKGIANLAPGVYRYYKGKHKNKYWALRPFPEGRPSPVIRDGIGESTAVAVNIHKGGLNNTWSEGCQTVVKTQYEAFIKLVYSEMDRCGQKTIIYILVENKI